MNVIMGSACLFFNQTDRNLHSALDTCLFTPAYIQFQRIRWQLGVNGQVVLFTSDHHRGERAVSVSALHKWSGHGPAIRLLSGDQQTDPLLSKQSPPPVKGPLGQVHIYANCMWFSLHPTGMICECDRLTIKPVHTGPGWPQSAIQKGPVHVWVWFRCEFRKKFQPDSHLKR